MGNTVMPTRLLIARCLLEEAQRYGVCPAKILSSFIARQSFMETLGEKFRSTRVLITDGMVHESIATAQALAKQMRVAFGVTDEDEENSSSDLPTNWEAGVGRARMNDCVDRLLTNRF
jgi:hypothetical protein